MYEITVTDEKCRVDPYRTVNFQRTQDGTLICPNGKSFHFYVPSLFEETSMAERKNCIYLKGAKTVHIVQNVTKGEEVIVL